LPLERSSQTTKQRYWSGKFSSHASPHFAPGLKIHRDTRKFGQPIVEYIESHSDDITELQFHPTQPQILLSGSTDGLVNIYNTTITDEEEALHQTINHGHSIHHADFLSETDIFALSHDERFSMYELVTNPEEGVEEPSPVHYGDMREMLGGEYVANVLRRPDGGAVIGVGSHR
jgi:WD40 repeat protein